MASRFVYSVQSFLKWKGINPGPLDGDIGPLTSAAWNLFLDSEEGSISPPAIDTLGKSKSPTEAQTGETGALGPNRTLASAELIAAAKANVGKFLMVLMRKSGVGSVFRNPRWSIYARRILSQLMLDMDRRSSQTRIITELIRYSCSQIW